MNVENRTIFENDNLHILRGLDSETIDLIYLDPPFNSNRTYEAPIGSEAAGAAFKDAWTLSDLDNAWHGELSEHEPALYSAISAAGVSFNKSMKAYLIMMGIRMLEMRRVLKPTGSIYLHCDPTASHYLKTMMDSIFGQQNFRNEIVWQRIQGAGKAMQHEATSYGRSTDHILFYAYSNSKFDINSDLVPFSSDYLKKFKYRDKKGQYTRRNPFRPPGLGERPNLCYEYKGFYPPNPSGWTVALETLKKLDEEGDLEFVNGKVYRKHRLKEGMPANNLWLDIPPALGGERLGYPTQKPLKLLERIIKASSNRGDFVLDPFCGCATTCIAAEIHQRQWIGIDLSPKAVELVKLRLERELDLAEHPNLLGQVIHRTDIPKRLYPEEPRQIHIETLFGQEERTDLILSEVELGEYRYSLFEELIPIIESQPYKNTTRIGFENILDQCKEQYPINTFKKACIMSRSILKDNFVEVCNVMLISEFERVRIKFEREMAEPEKEMTEFEKEIAEGVIEASVFDDTYWKNSRDYLLSNPKAHSTRFPYTSYTLYLFIAFIIYQKENSHNSKIKSRTSLRDFEYLFYTYFSNVLFVSMDEDHKTYIEESEILKSREHGSFVYMPHKNDDPVKYDMGMRYIQYGTLY